MKIIKKHIIFLFFSVIIIIAGQNTSYSFNSINSNRINSNKILSGTEIAKNMVIVHSVEADSALSNRITKVWYTASELNVQIYQVFKQQDIEISVYNMLGKEVLEIFRGKSSSKDEETYSTSFNLPNGIYICILQGKNFRSSEKFIISR